LSFIQLLQSAWEKNYVGTNLARLKYDLSQNNWLVFVVFFIYNFHLSFFSVFKLLFRYVFSLLFSGVFSNVIRYSKRMEILLFSVSFLRVQISRLLSRGKEKNITSCFLTSFNTPQVEFFLLIFLNILASHLFN